jgi:hypothetical protein
MINAASPASGSEDAGGVLGENCPKGHPLKPFFTPVDGYVLASPLYNLSKVFMQQMWPNDGCLIKGD